MKCYLCNIEIPNPYDYDEICTSCKKKLSIKKYKKSDIILYKSNEDLIFLRDAIKIEDLLT